MNDVQFKLNETNHGYFYVQNGGEKLAQMVISIAGTHLTVYHTEVLPKAEGQGLAGELLKTMVAYARQHGLQVVPLCPYVHAQFRRHPELYEDIWVKQPSDVNP